ncbi:MAG: hypothetical protein WCP98_00700 [Actinomycetes bacterium]
MRTVEHALADLLELLPQAPTARKKLDDLELVQTPESRPLGGVTVSSGVAQWTPAAAEEATHAPAL